VLPRVAAAVVPAALRACALALLALAFTPFWPAASWAQDYPNKTVRIIVRKTFKSYDCEILEAGNGVEGLALAAKAMPDLILLDVTMPVMDGVTMLTKLKADEALKAIPVIMLTAESGRENVLHIARLGVRDYLVKPFKDDQLIEKAGRVIALQKRAVAA